MFLRHHSFKILGAAVLMLAVSTGFAAPEAPTIAQDPVLEQRVNHAVDNICGSAHARSTWEQVNYAACSRAAHADVQTKVDSMVAAAENARKMAGARSSVPGM